MQEEEPWEGFGEDKRVWRRQELQITEVEGAGDAECADDVDYVDYVDCFHCAKGSFTFFLEREAEASEKADRILEGDPECAEGKSGKDWKKGLTREEAQETEDEHPELVEALSLASEWTEEELIEKAKELVRVDAATRVAIGASYKRFECLPAESLFLPPKLAPSTTMADTPYPLAGQLERSLSRLRLFTNNIRGNMAGRTDHPSYASHPCGSLRGEQRLSQP